MDSKDIDYEALLALALKASEGSYAPYSKYSVGWPKTDRSTPAPM